MDLNIANAVMSEQRFWLQIMGDHARFIFYALSPSETGEIPKAQTFIMNYDNLLVQARRSLTAAEAKELNNAALKLANDFKSFKLQLLALTLSSKISLNLTSTLLNHMLNEIDEYITTMSLLSSGQMQIFNPIHYHLLWLSDAVGHSAAVSSNLDEVEKDMIENSMRFEKLFTNLYMKSVNLNGYMRTKINSFPALEMLNQQAVMTMVPFMDLLENLKLMRKDGSILGILKPLMADHMYREECYYLTKLSESAKNVKKPDCNPGRPRFE